MAKPQMSLRLPEKKQQQWKDYAQESDDVRNRTELIERAVETYIEAGGFEDEGELAQKEAVNTLQETVHRLESAMQEVQSDLRAIKRQTAAASDNVKRLAHDVLERLPASQEVDVKEARQYLGQKEAGSLSQHQLAPSEGPELPVTAKTLHSWMEEDPDVDYDFPVTPGDVEDALEYLRDQHVVRSVEIEGKTRWVKEV